MAWQRKFDDKRKREWANCDPLRFHGSLRWCLPSIVRPSMAVFSHGSSCPGSQVDVHAVLRRAVHSVHIGLIICSSSSKSTTTTTKGHSNHRYAIRSTSIPKMCSVCSDHYLLCAVAVAARLIASRRNLCGKCRCASHASAAVPASLNFCCRAALVGVPIDRSSFVVFLLLRLIF